MKEYKRKYPMFSLCGLNCCFCPRFHTEGSSRCPGCGGENFYSIHPTCAVITCSKKHGDVEFCYECSEYPCQKYKAASKVDSFISYKNVLTDQEAAKADLTGYINNLNRKYEILLELINNYNDGKSKGFYCLAANLLPLPALEGIMNAIHSDKSFEEATVKVKAERLKSMMMQQATALDIELLLRK